MTTKNNAIRDAAAYLASRGYMVIYEGVPRLLAELVREELAAKDEALRMAREPLSLFLEGNTGEAVRERAQAALAAIEKVLK